MRPRVQGTFSEGLTIIVFPVAKAIGIVQNGTYINYNCRYKYHDREVEWDDGCNDAQG